jgi:hypothetical protein
MAEDTGGFTLPPEQSAWSNIDWKPLLIGTAMSMSPELKHMAPLFMKAFQEGSQNAQAKRFAQGLMGAQKLMAEGNVEAAQQAMQAVAQITPPGMINVMNKAASDFAIEAQKQKASKAFQQAAQVTGQSMDPRVAAILPYVSESQRLELIRPGQVKEGAVIGTTDPFTRQISGIQMLPQAPEAPSSQEFTAQAARQGQVPAMLTNALRSSDPEIQAAGIRVLQGTQNAADLQKIQQVGQEATARTAATKATELSYMDQETQKLVARESEKKYAEIVAGSQGKNVLPYTEAYPERVLYDTATRQRAPYRATGNDALQPDSTLVPLTQKEFSVVRDMKGAIEHANRIEELAGKVLSDKPGQNLITGVKRLVERKLGTNEDIGALDSARALTLGLAKLIQGDSRISETDWKIINNFNPSDFETIGVARARTKELKGALQRVEEAITGRPVTSPTGPMSIDDAMKKYLGGPANPQ